MGLQTENGLFLARRITMQAVEKPFDFLEKSFDLAEKEARRKR